MEGMHRKRCSLSYLLIIDDNTIVGAGHQEDVTTVDLRPGPKQSKGLHSLPILGMYIFAHHPHSLSHFQGCSLERTMCC